MSARHILWINQEPRLIGGCEVYIHNTAQRLNELGIRSSFLYDPTLEEVSTPFLQVFEGAYPMVDLPRQIREIAPDLLYVHRVHGIPSIRQLAESGVPSVRFFHDSHLFCLRKYKYKTLTHATCTKPVGMRCYPCLGFVNKSNNALGISFSTVAGLRAEIRANQQLDAFVTGSHYMARHAAEHGFDEGRIRVIPLYAPQPMDGASEIREADLLLFVGQLVRGKGLDTLLRALTKTQQPARLMVVGTGSQEGMFRRLGEDLGISDRVEFAGRVSHDALAEYYQRAACTVFPSRTPESFGLVGPESHSYRTPVIAAMAGGVEEWLEDGVTGYGVPPNDPAELARAIDRMLADPAKAAEMGEEGRRRYEAKFRPEHHVERLAQYFEELVAGRSAA